MSDEQDQYEHYNYDPPVSGGSGASGKGRSKREVADKAAGKSHTAKDARKVEEQITNAEQKQKDKMKKQNSKE